MDKELKLLYVRIKTMQIIERKDFISADRLLKCLDEMIRNVPVDIDDLRSI